MTAELIGGAILCTVGTLSLIAYLAHRAEQSKITKVRVLASAANEVQKCWGILDKVPTGYLPSSMRKLVGRSLEYTVGATLKVDPENPFFREQDTRTKQLLANLGNESTGSSRPVLTPQDRKEVAARLRDLRRLTNKAQDRGLIAAPDCTKQQHVIDTMLLRIMVDHLKQNAFNSETISHPEDAIGYLAKALEGLSAANDGGRYSDEITAIGGEMERMQVLARTEQEKRRNATPNRLLQAIQNEVPKRALGAPGAHAE